MLNYISLAVVWLGAMVGIWSRRDQNKLLGVISSLISTAALAVGVAMTYVSAENAAKNSALEKTRYESGLRTAVAQDQPIDINVEWIFDQPPAGLSSVFDAWAMYGHSQAMRDDDFGRAPRSVQQALLADDYLTQVVSPLIRQIVTPAGDLLADFPADTKTNLATWKGFEQGGPGDKYDFMPDVYYRGPAFEVLMPVGTNGKAVLSLGDTSDDPVFAEADRPPGNNVYNDAKMFAFDTAASLDGKLTLNWRYSSDSLPRAIAQDGTASARASLPPAFDLIVVRGDLPKTDYVSKGGKLILEGATTPAGSPAATQAATQAAADWTAASRLRVTFNGLSDAQYTYRVTRAGDGEYKTDMGAYDGAAKEFDYTRFHCVLEEAPAT